MGRCKQLLRINGQSMISKVVSGVLKSMVEDVLVVLGHRADDISTVLPNQGVETVFNPDFKEGMGSSLRVGVKGLSGETEAFLVVLGDQPFLEPDTIDRIISKYERIEADIVAPFYKGTRGNPVLFDYSLKKKIIDITGDIGAREILERKEEHVSRVEVSSPSVLIDVNTEEDFKRIQRYGKDIEAMIDGE
ncbi:hypothetical protein AKJ52_01605 [candidate division MSBL1 archaeon SCGC-AAA382C18]|uniref:MobA-like NTP transferase domain-containing protein n=1 Tax=candidate division MSBL1 archaeon SCGC-AAA382C18 TaxID=1698281 RepID=A0A133VK20_9EURY|nr:hypothetical protein AKJ52_01605 [candidate division MSBL1 archaeon SCGC-AAA382C18]